jgi:hypothetical protein
VGGDVATSGMVLIQERDKPALLKRAGIHLLHHGCAILCCVFPVVIFNFMEIQPVKPGALHGTVFAAFYRCISRVLKQEVSS